MTSPERRQLKSADYEARIAELERQLLDAQALNARNSIDLTYGCLTKIGLVAALRSIDASGLVAIYFDLDRFKETNERYGKFATNAIVAECIKPRGYDILGQAPRTMLVGRWFSGDELAGVFMPQDVMGYYERVKRNFARYGITGTFVVAPALYKGSAIATLDYCERAISLLKKRDLRALIVSIGA